MSIFHRVSIGAFGVIVGGGLLSIVNCAANLDDPQSFAPAGVSTGATSGGGSGSVAGAGGSGTVMYPMPQPTPCVTTVLTSNCATIGCHKGATAAASLDLTPNATLASRLSNVPAPHSDETGTCTVTGSLLVDANNPAASWMLAKVTHKQPATCGQTMPADGTDNGLTGDDLTCFTAYINSFKPGAAAATGN